MVLSVGVGTYKYYLNKEINNVYNNEYSCV